MTYHGLPRIKQMLLVQSYDGKDIDALNYIIIRFTIYKVQSRHYWLAMATNLFMSHSQGLYLLLLISENRNIVKIKCNLSLFDLEHPSHFWCWEIAER